VVECEAVLGARRGGEGLVTAGAVASPAARLHRRHWPRGLWVAAIVWLDSATDEAWYGCARQPSNPSKLTSKTPEFSETQNFIALPESLTITPTTQMSRFFRQAADSDSESSDSEESLLSSDDEAAPAKAAPAKPAMSRFLRLANDDSDSSSSESKSEDEDGSDDDDDAPKEAKAKKSAFLRDSDDEESDEEVKRVVKSARDKRLEEMEGTGKTMDNALKINDWIAISAGEWTVLKDPAHSTADLYV
jgi:hypothetical protein